MYFAFPSPLLAPRKGCGWGAALPPDALYPLGRGGWLRSLFHPSCLLGCTSRDAHSCSAQCYPALGREEFQGPVACYTFPPSSHELGELMHPSVMDHHSLGTRRRAGQPCTCAIGEEIPGKWEGLRQGGQGCLQDPVCMGPWLAYILHSGVGLHDVFLHLVGIFLQALYELSQLFAGDAGKKKGEKEGDLSPHKHGHSPKLLLGAALGVL